MARIRTIKPDFFTSADIVGLSIAARYLYSGLWCESDREGRFKMNEKTLKMRYMPTDDVDFLGLLRELVRAGLVVPYDGVFAYIPTFTRHQVINNKESESVIPRPPDDCSKYIEEFLSRESDATFTRKSEEESIDQSYQNIGPNRSVTEATFTRESRVKDATCGKERKEGRKEEIHTSPTGSVAAAPVCDFSPDEKPKREKVELSAKDLMELGVTEPVAKAWLAVRKRKKLSLTKPAMDRMLKEVEKAGITLQQAIELCCEKSWGGFDAEWAKGSFANGVNQAMLDSGMDPKLWAIINGPGAV